MGRGLTYVAIALWVGFSLVLLSAVTVSAHSGGKDAQGCHVDGKTGERHCHVSPPKSDKTDSPPCQDLPRCRGCGCRGGPGYRDRDTKKCVGYEDLERVCGRDPKTRCDFENAPNTGVNRVCVTGETPEPELVS